MGTEPRDKPRHHIAGLKLAAPHRDPWADADGGDDTRQYGGPGTHSHGDLDEGAWQPCTREFSGPGEPEIAESTINGGRVRSTALREGLYKVYRPQDGNLGRRSLLGLMRP